MRIVEFQGNSGPRRFLFEAVIVALALLLRPGTVTAATITVTSAADNTTLDGAVTLREAMTSINNGADLNADVTANRTGTYGTSDTINFNIPGGGVHTISPTSLLPSITKSVLIDGYSQPGASANTLAVGDNAVLLIEINGTNIATFRVFNIPGPAGGVTIRGFVINRTQGGYAFVVGSAGVSSSNNVIAGNFIGVDPTGAILPAATQAPQVTFADGSSNTFGGSTPAARNIMAGNFFSGTIYILLQGAGSNDVIQGNYLGLNASGTAKLSNGGGVGIEVDTDNNTIGGTAPGAGNVIGGVQIAIFITGFTGGGNNNFVQGNRIGTNAAGTAALSNVAGISAGGSNNTIGGSLPGAGNLISGNGGGGGIAVGGTGYTIQGNKIGTDIIGTLPIPNVGDGIFLSSGSGSIGGVGSSDGNIIAFNGGLGVSLTGSITYPILGNSIFSNGGLGIGSGATVVPNDDCDADTGPNEQQNFPVITSASIAAGQVTISGTLNSIANRTFRIEFFSSASCDPSGNGEGQTFLGFTTLTTGACPGTNTPNGSFGPVSFAIPGGQTVITATATLLTVGSLLPVETSEFSACFSAGGQPGTPTNTPTNTPTGQPTSTPTNTPTSMPTNTPAGVATNTPTVTPTGSPTQTPTVGQVPAAVVPTLSFPMLVLLALALVATAIFLFRRS
jgi:hypothetical protein